MIRNSCEGCLGECPENCEYCIYFYCKKPVDYGVVQWHYEHDDYEEFNKWFRIKFQLD